MGKIMLDPSVAFYTQITSNELKINVKKKNRKHNT